MITVAFQTPENSKEWEWYYYSTFNVPTFRNPHARYAGAEKQQQQQPPPLPQRSTPTICERAISKSMHRMGNFLCHQSWNSWGAYSEVPETNTPVVFSSFGTKAASWKEQEFDLWLRIQARSKKLDWNFPSGWSWTHNSSLQSKALPKLIYSVLVNSSIYLWNLLIPS